MKRSLAIGLATIAMLVTFATPAMAATGQEPRPLPPTLRPHITVPLLPPLCVTTTWRSKHTHRPKTRPGTVCVGTPDMWIPKAYQLVYRPLGTTLAVYTAR